MRGPACAGKGDGHPEREGERRGHHAHQRVLGELAVLLAAADGDAAAEQEQRDDEPAREQVALPPPQTEVGAHFGLRYSAWMFPAMSKIGRYIATIMNATMPPMTMSITGSSSEVSAATAMSTSSS